MYQLRKTLLRGMILGANQKLTEERNGYRLRVLVKSFD